MSNALVPLNEMQTMAKACAESGLFGAKTPAQALTIMLIAQAEGRHPMSAAKDYDIINGKPAKKAEAMLRDFLSQGGKVEWHKYADDGCDATFTHPQGGSVRVDWNKARMEKAKIANEAMYNKFPRPMYRARCISEGVRTVCPGATGGLYVPDEVRAFAPEKNMGAAEVVVQDERLKVAPEQIEAIHTALSECAVTEKALIEEINRRTPEQGNHISSLAELAAEDAPGAIKWVRKQKKPA